MSGIRVLEDAIAAHAAAVHPGSVLVASLVVYEVTCIEGGEQLSQIDYCSPSGSLSAAAGLAHVGLADITRGLVDIANDED